MGVPGRPRRLAGLLTPAGSARWPRSRRCPCARGRRRRRRRLGLPAGSGRPSSTGWSSRCSAGCTPGTRTVVAPGDDPAAVAARPAPAAPCSPQCARPRPASASAGRISRSSPAYRWARPAAAVLASRLAELDVRFRTGGTVRGAGADPDRLAPRHRPGARSRGGDGGRRRPAVPAAPPRRGCSPTPPRPPPPGSAGSRRPASRWSRRSRPEAGPGAARLRRARAAGRAAPVKAATSPPPSGRGSTRLDPRHVVVCAPRSGARRGGGAATGRRRPGRAALADLAVLGGDRCRPVARRVQRLGRRRCRSTPSATWTGMHAVEAAVAACPARRCGAALHGVGIPACIAAAGGRRRRVLGGPAAGAE